MRIDYRGGQRDAGLQQRVQAVRHLVRPFLPFTAGCSLSIREGIAAAAAAR